MSKFEYEIRETLTGKVGSLEDFQTSTEVVASHAALQEALSRVHDRGYLQDGARLVMHYTRAFYHEGEGAVIWPPKDRKDGFSSPWIEVRASDRSSAKNPTEIHVFASDLRLMSDLYAWRNGLNTSVLISHMTTITQSCFEIAVEQYVEAATTAQSTSVDTGFFNNLRCSPTSLDEPLINLFELAPNAFRGSFLSSVLGTLDACRVSNQKFYSELYEALIVHSLSAWSNGSHSSEDWWIDAIGRLAMGKCDGATAECLGNRIVFSALAVCSGVFTNQDSTILPASVLLSPTMTMAVPPILLGRKGVGSESKRQEA